MPTELCSECHRNPVERGRFVCDECDVRMLETADSDPVTQGARRAAAGPTMRGKGAVTTAPWERWRLSPVFIALIAVVIWSCSMAWQAYQHPVAVHRPGLPAWMEDAGKKISSNAHHVIDTMK